MIKQITVFLENKPGRMEEVTGCLAQEGINIHALAIADTTDFGIVRMIVSDHDKTLEALKAKGFMVKTAEVLAVAIGHSPGSLHKVLRKLRELDISIEYMFAFTSRHKNYDAIVILSIKNHEAAAEALIKGGFPVLEQDLINQLNC